MKSILVISCFLFTSFLYAQHDHHQHKTNTDSKGHLQSQCPIMNADINKNIHTDYKGKRIYFCCTSCVEEFKKDPDKYLMILKKNKIQTEDSPAK